MKTDEFTLYFEKVNDIFSESFTEAYKSLNGRSKSKVLTYTTSLYRRWYYSASVENTYLTPANILLSLCQDQEPGIMTASSISLNDPLGLQGFVYKLNQYTLEDHPMLADFKLFLSSCHPDMTLTSGELLTKEHNQFLFDKVSLWDLYYIDYLKELAIQLECIKKSPAIHSIKAKTTAKYEPFLQLSPRAALELMVEAAISLAATKIGEIIVPVMGTSAIQGFLRDMFYKARSLDEIFDYFFSFLGINFKTVWDMQGDEDSFSQFAEAIQSSTFYMGVILDRYFFTPFGHYFKLIQPIYALPFDFRNELAFVYKTIQDPEGDVTSSLYAPCSSYVLTPLGIDFFQIETVDKTLLVPESAKLAMLKLLESGLDGTNLTEEDVLHLYALEAGQGTAGIYEVKVKLGNNKLYWKNIELPDHYTLHDFFHRICFEFDLDPGADYSFFLDENENRFTAYYSPNHKNRAKKADSITLEQLSFAPKHRFGLTLYNTTDPFQDELKPVKRLQLELEMMKTKKPGYDKVYPRVSRESQAFKELFMDFEF